MANLTLRAVFQAVDRITGPVRRIAEAIGGGLGRALGRVSAAAGAMGDRIRRARARLDELNSSTARTHRSTGMLTRTVGLLGGALAGLSIGRAVASMLKIGMTFEGFRIALTTSLGSVRKADDALGWIQTFAKRTPYELAEVTEAFQTLQGAGIDPMSGALERLGNAASGKNKTLMDAVQMMMDAQMGSFERLPEFDIKGSQKGNDAIFMYTLNGKDTVKKVKKTAAGIREAILSIFDERFGGGMEAQSKSAFGMLSGIKDYWTSFSLMADKAGMFDVFKSKLSGFLNALGAAEGSGQMSAWAAALGAAMGTLFEALANLASSIDWVALINGLAGAITGITNFVTSIGGFGTVIDLGIASFIASMVFGLNALAPAIAVVASALLGFNIAAGPITLIIVGIAALAAGAFLLWRNWDKVKKFFAGLFDWVAKNFMSLPLPLKWLAMPIMIIKNWGAISGFFGGLFKRLASFWKGLPWWMQAMVNLPLTIISHWGKIAPAIAKAWSALASVFKSGVNAVWNAMPEWMQGILKGVLTATRFVTGGPDLAADLPSRPSPNVAGRRNEFQGHLGIAISQEGRPRVTEMRSNNDHLDLSLKRGIQGAF